MVRCQFVKWRDLSGYSEKSNIQEAYFPKTNISGQNSIVSEIFKTLLAVSNKSNETNSEKNSFFFFTSDFKNSITVSCTDYSFTAVRRWLLYMPTLVDYLWVSQIPHRSPALWYGSPHLPDKIIFWAFLCLGLKFSPFLAQNVIFSYSQYGFWGIFARI